MHAVCLREVYIHPDEPWCWSTLCVRVTCKVHKLVRQDDSYMQEPYHPFHRGGIYLQETIASSFRTLGWSSSGPKALEGFKPLRRLVTPSFETTMSSMKGADLLRNGTSLWSFLLNTSENCPLNSSACSISEAVIPAPPLSLRRGIPWLSFFLTIDVTIEVSRICLNITNQVIYIQIVLLPNIILNFFSQSFKFCSEILTARLSCFSMSFVSSANLPSYFRGYLGNRRDWPTSFGRDVFICHILNKRGNQVKVLLYWASICITVEIFFFCKFKRIFPHRFIITFLI